MHADVPRLPMTVAHLISMAHQAGSVREHVVHHQQILVLHSCMCERLAHHCVTLRTDRRPGTPKERTARRNMVRRCIGTLISAVMS